MVLSRQLRSHAALRDATDRVTSCWRATNCLSLGRGHLGSWSPCGVLMASSRGFLHHQLLVEWSCWSWCVTEGLMLALVAAEGRRLNGLRCWLLQWSWGLWCRRFRNAPVRLAQLSLLFMSMDWIVLKCRPWELFVFRFGNSLSSRALKQLLELTTHLSILQRLRLLKLSIFRHINVVFDVVRLQLLDSLDILVWLVKIDLFILTSFLPRLRLLTL